MVYSAKSDDTDTISQFTHRKDITITTGGTSTPASYQVKVTISYEPEMQADFGDIRFNTKAGGYIDYWIESKTDSVNATVWIELPDAITDPGSDTIRMYYGNAWLSGGGVGADTFIQYHGTATANYQDSAIVGPNDIAYETSVKATGTLANAYLLTGIGVNVPAGDEGGDQLRAVQHNPSGDTYYASWNNGVQTYFYNSPAIGDGAFHHYKITFDGTTATYHRDSVNKGTNTVNLPNEAMGLRFSVKAGTGEQEWSFVRKYITNEPTTTYGTSQHQRRTPQFIN